MALGTFTDDLWSHPIIPIYIITPLLIAVLVFYVVMLLRKERRTREVVFSALRILMVFVLVFIINLRPMRAGDQADLETRNVDVLFVVDTTISMWAQDYNGTNERMDGVLADCAYIMEQLAGANFGLIRFDNRGQILAPFTQDARNVSDAFDTIRSPDRDYATGTDMSAPYKQMQELLVSSNAKEDRKTVVFFISDGEITNGAPLTSYVPLAGYIDTGAVLGYGTEEGARMREGGYTSYVYDPDTDAAAVSRIDENNLRQIASDLGVDYIYMDRPDRVDAIIAYIRMIAKATVSESTIITFEDTYYYYVIPLLVLLVIELIRTVLYRKL